MSIIKKWLGLDEEEETYTIDAARALRKRSPSMATASFVQRILRSPNCPAIRYAPTLKKLPINMATR